MIAKLTGCAAVAGALALAMAVPQASAQTPPPAAPPPPDQPSDQVRAVEQSPATQPVAPDSRKLHTATVEEEEDDDDEAKKDDDDRAEVQWGVGARLRWINTPQWMINAFVEHSTPMTSLSVAGEVIRRKGNFDIVLSLEYANVSPEDGLWQEKGEDPSMLGMYPDYIDFDGLALLSGDVSFIWHLPIASYLSFRYGAGIGLGIPLGSISQTDTTCASNTTVDDLDNPMACTLRPETKEDADIPPIVPIVNVVLGFRFKVADQVSFQVEGGWRFPSFFLGGGLGYFF